MGQSYFQFYNPTKVLSGEGAIKNLGFELNMLNLKKPLILTDKGISRLGLVDKITRIIHIADIKEGTIYDDIPLDSDVRVINKISDIFRSINCDSIIAIGGGSVIDTAKGVNISVSNNVADIMSLAGVDNLKTKMTPLIVIPTTSGTGSETTGVAVIASHEKKEKYEFLSDLIVPDMAILDPEMTKSLPLSLTISTGTDAIVHAIEALTCKQKNPISTAYAKEALAILIEYLPKVLEKPQNLEFRNAVQVGAYMAGAAFSNSMVGLVHAIGHSCGGIAGVPHGHAMFMLVVPCMKYNVSLLPDLYDGIYQDMKSKEFIDFMEGFLENLVQSNAIKDRLNMYDIDTEIRDKIAHSAMYDPAILMNPVEPTEEDVRNILKIIS